MIPLENASLVEKRHALQFRKWLEETAANADAILTISRDSRQVHVHRRADRIVAEFTGVESGKRKDSRRAVSTTPS
jgi:hypothetical protein